MKWTGFGNVGTIIEEEGYDCFWVASMNLVVRVDNKLLKTSFKKSEVSNRLILNIDFWFFILIFMIWNNQDLSDDWFFKSDKISIICQNLALWFNQLSASDFLKDVFHTSYIFSRIFFLRIVIKEGLNMWPQKYFSPPRI